jgi:hypothetical protein
MQTAQYRIYIDGKSIGQAALDKIESVVVQQEMDQTWQATLELLTCTTEKGLWHDEADTLLKPFRRARIELSLDGKKTWVPLIDGPVVGYDSALSPEPSQSTISVRVSDDSIYLWRKEEPRRWSGDRDSEIARNIFAEGTNIADTRIDKTDPLTSDRASGIMQRGTMLDTLHVLAARNEAMHAWVAPGDKPGKSLGMFKKEEERPSGLPALVLLGPGRNLDSFTCSADGLRPATVTSWSLDLRDLSVKKGKASYGEVKNKKETDVVDFKQLADLMVPPGYAYGVDPAVKARSLASRYGQIFDASGVVSSRCYAGVLQPYKVVEVTGVNGVLSGNYLIRSVAHTLTRSQYSQQFTLVRRGQSAGAGSADKASLQKMARK